MIKSSGKPRAFATDDGKMICCLNSKFIYIDQEGKYAPSKHEKAKLVAINNIEWSFALGWCKEPILLSKEQITLVEKAFIERNEYLLALRFKSLHDLSQEESFSKIISLVESCSKESKELKNILGSVIFRGNFPIIGLYTLEQKEEIIKAYRNINLNIETGLVQLIKRVEAGIKRSKLKPIAQVKKTKEVSCIK